ncbi:hypothetical protein EDD36DRAFT_483247 [Exophiala viscosa]|uniref:Apple domain-containing protein n=1 Tax=Exophiala viscosa TaxID=2486360 RepID=A0AAN6DLW5_9EURO|nr:hypothetical protein EDD36DRAFT_483247 [Exophiala viscosa]
MLYESRDYRELSDYHHTPGDQVASDYQTKQVHNHHTSTPRDTTTTPAISVSSTSSIPTITNTTISTNTITTTYSTITTHITTTTNTTTATNTTTTISASTTSSYCYETPEVGVFTGDGYYICTGADRPGGDLYDFDADSEGHCIQTCDREQDMNSDCVGVVFQPSDNHCWLKNILEEQVADTLYYNAARGTQVTLPTETCSYIGDVNMEYNGCTFAVSCGYALSGDSLYDESSVASCDDCIESCAGSYGCAAMAYSYGTGRCYSYGDVASLVEDSSFASAVWNADTDC